MGVSRTAECPRCGGKNVEIIAESPVANKWNILGCGECNYLWRDTEHLEGIVKLTSEMAAQAATVHFG